METNNVIAGQGGGRGRTRRRRRRRGGGLANVKPPAGQDDQGFFGDHPRSEATGATRGGGWSGHRGRGRNPWPRIRSQGNHQESDNLMMAEFVRSPNRPPPVGGGVRIRRKRAQATHQQPGREALEQQQEPQAFPSGAEARADNTMQNSTRFGGDTNSSTRARTETARTESSKPKAGTEIARTESSKPRAGTEIARTESSKPRAGTETARTESSKPRAGTEIARTESSKPRAGTEIARTESSKPRAGTEIARTESSKPRAGTETARTESSKPGGEAETTRTQSSKLKKGAETARTESSKARAGTETARTESSKPRAGTETVRTQSSKPRGEAETTRTESSKPKGGADTARSAQTRRTESSKARGGAELTKTAESPKTKEGAERARTESSKVRGGAETARTESSRKIGGIGSQNVQRGEMQLARPPKMVKSEQGEILERELREGSRECCICIAPITRKTPIWFCELCFVLIHVPCMQGYREQKLRYNGSSLTVPCPQCNAQIRSSAIDFKCWCGRVRDFDSLEKSYLPFSCGKPCPRFVPKANRDGRRHSLSEGVRQRIRFGSSLRRPQAGARGSVGSTASSSSSSSSYFSSSCGHRCPLVCHPGPCPPCKWSTTRKCPCKAFDIQVTCGDTKTASCGTVCDKLLDCGAHRCTKVCHADACGQCNSVQTRRCWCDQKIMSVDCKTVSSYRRQMRSQGEESVAAAAPINWSCGLECGRTLNCGIHRCTKKCHPGNCSPCPLLNISTCPCGKTRLRPNLNRSCLDPIPVCGNKCLRKLKCGHLCDNLCHEGDCDKFPCNMLTKKFCKCQQSSKFDVCAVLSRETGRNIPCSKVCNTDLHCGLHKCQRVCCAERGKEATSINSAHLCTQQCLKPLTCGRHSCPEHCHAGRPCQACAEVIRFSAHCPCGKTVIRPPSTCARLDMSCGLRCDKPRPCGHRCTDKCHTGPCSDCTSLVNSVCVGGHTTRRWVYCYCADDGKWECGKPCAKKIHDVKVRSPGEEWGEVEDVSAEAHKCSHKCHAGDCPNEETCDCVCGRPSLSCRHKCKAVCHEMDECYGSVCEEEVKIYCECKYRWETRKCGFSRGEYYTRKDFKAAKERMHGKLPCDETCAGILWKLSIGLALGSSLAYAAIKASKWFFLGAFALDSFLSSSRKSELILFTSDSCRSCPELVTRLEDLQPSLLNSTINLKVVDGTHESDLVRFWNIEGFPSLLFVRDDNVIDEFEIHKDEDDKYDLSEFMPWVERRLVSGIDLKLSFEEFGESLIDTLVTHQDSSDVVVVGVVDKVSLDALTKASERLRHLDPFIVFEDEHHKIRKWEGQRFIGLDENILGINRITIMKKRPKSLQTDTAAAVWDSFYFDIKDVGSDDELMWDLYGWIATQTLPIFGELTVEKQKLYMMQGGRPYVWLIMPNETMPANVHEVMSDLAYDLNYHDKQSIAPSLLPMSPWFVWLDKRRYEEFVVRNLNVTETPAMIVTDIDDESVIHVPLFSNDFDQWGDFRNLKQGLINTLKETKKPKPMILWKSAISKILSLSAAQLSLSVLFPTTERNTSGSSDGGGSITIAMVYSVDCEWCETLKPAFEESADLIKDAHINFAFISMDDSVDGKLADTEVQMIPSIWMFEQQGESGMKIEILNRNIDSPENLKDWLAKTATAKSSKLQNLKDEL